MRDRVDDHRCPKPYGWLRYAVRMNVAEYVQAGAEVLDHSVEGRKPAVCNILFPAAETLGWRVSEQNVDGWTPAPAAREARQHLDA